MMQKSIIFFFLLFFSLHLKSENLNTEKELIYKNIYNLNFPAADSLLKTLKSKDPTFFYITKAYINWWNIIISKNNENYKSNYLKYLDSSYSSLGKTKIKQMSYEHIFYAINIYASKTRLKIMQKEYFKAILNLKDCIHFIEYSLGKENAYKEFNLTSGLYNYCIEYATTEYPFLFTINFFYPKGDKNKGLSQLNIASKNQSELINTEAAYFLYKIYFDLEKKYDFAEKNVEVLCNKYPLNHFFVYLHFTIKIENKKWEDALLLLNKIKMLSEYNKNITFEQKQYIYLLALKEYNMAKIQNP